MFVRGVVDDNSGSLLTFLNEGSNVCGIGIGIGERKDTEKMSTCKVAWN